MNDLIKYDDPTYLSRLRNSCAKNANDDEFWQFLELCKATGLDPIKKEIWCVVYERKDKNGNSKRDLQIMVGINGYRGIANSHPQYDGSDGPFFEKDDKGNIVSCEYWVYRKDRGYPAKGFVIFNEVAQRNYKGELSGAWAKRPIGQLVKCAEAEAMRKAFPMELSGTYIEDEMPAIEVNPNGNGNGNEKDSNTSPTKPMHKPRITENNVSTEDLRNLLEQMKNLGFTSKDVCKEFISKAVGRDLASLKHLKVEELGKVIDELNATWRFRQSVQPDRNPIDSEKFRGSLQREDPKDEEVTYVDENGVILDEEQHVEAV